MKFEKIRILQRRRIHDYDDDDVDDDDNNNDDDDDDDDSYVNKARGSLARSGGGKVIRASRFFSVTWTEAQANGEKKT